MIRRMPVYAALFVIGFGLLSLAIAGDTAFLGAAVVFSVAGVAGLAREKKTARQSKDDQNTA